MKPHGLTVEKSQHLPGDHHGPVACRNCGHVFIGKYCPECSQRADTHRITWHYIWHEIPHSIWHVDKGILFTLRELFTRPGYTIREFLDGKRVNHYRPLALILLLGGILTFVLHSFDVRMTEETQRIMGMQQKSQTMVTMQQQINQFAERYQNLIQIALLPLTSLFTHLFFRRRGLNYPEHLVANTFLANIGLVLSIVSVLLFKLTGGSSMAYGVATGLTSVLAFGYRIVAFVQLFKDRLKRWTIVWRITAASILSFLALMVVSGLIGIVYGMFYLKPELQKQKQQKAASAVQAPLPQK